MIRKRTRRARHRRQRFRERQREAVVSLSAIVQSGYKGVAVLENDGKHVHDQPLALDRLCIRPGLSGQGKLAITVERIFSIGRSCIAMLEKSSESSYDWWWERIKSD